MSIKRWTYKYNPKTKSVEEMTPETPPELHSVIDDTIAPTVSPLSPDKSLVFDSRSELEAHYKANGYECTGGSHNIGRHAIPKRKVFDAPEERARKAEWGMLRVDPSLRADVAEEARKVKWGMAPLTEKERERCTREERIYKTYHSRQKA